MKKNLKMKLAHIQVNLKAKKSRYNGFGKYNYRAAEDILEAIKPFLETEQCTVTISEELISFDPPIMQSTASIIDAESEDAIHAVSIVGVDLGSKGMSMPQKFGAASSYAKKYALGNLLLIDDTADADSANNNAPVAKKTLTSEKDPAYAKAQEYIKGGGKVAAIAAKYSISKELEAALIKLETL